jgi:hypothetical protein
MLAKTTFSIGVFTTKIEMSAVGLERIPSQRVAGAE